MCYDPDVSKVVTEHHVQQAEKLRKSGQEEEALDYLRNNNVNPDHIGWKYQHLKDLINNSQKLNSKN